jgi:hypothetical protein
MTQDDKTFLKEFLRNSGFVGVVVGLFILFIALLSQPQNPPEQKFVVVDNYKGCDVVRYTPNHAYFLDCKK